MEDMRQLPLAFALLSFAILAPLPAATPVFHASFDNSNPAWTTLRGTAAIDTAVLHDGQKSMRVEPDAAAAMLPSDRRLSLSPSASDTN